MRVALLIAGKGTLLLMYGVEKVTFLCRGIFPLLLGIWRSTELNWSIYHHKKAICQDPKCRTAKFVSKIAHEHVRLWYNV
jgi:hypothetical protein